MLRTEYLNQLVPNQNTLVYTSLEQVSFLIILTSRSSSLLSPFPFDSPPAQVQVTLTLPKVTQLQISLLKSAILVPLQFFPENVDAVQFGLYLLWK
jgi:hypothetical protein